MSHCMYSSGQPKQGWMGGSADKTSSGLPPCGMLNNMGDGGKCGTIEDL